jgi:hypothetical protein
MPSIQDVADQINAKLDEINVNTAQTAVRSGEIKAELQTLNTRVSELDSHLVTGLANLAAGLFAIWEVEKASLVQLEHHSAQHDTMICLQENTNELLCGITRKLTAQIEIGRAVAAAVQRLEGIAERAEPTAAGDFDRLLQVKDRLAECCPPPVDKPEPCPEPCAVPDLKPYRPRGQGWKPQTAPDRVG